MDDLTRELAGFASSLRFDALPADVVHAAKQRLIDALGCAVASHACEPAQIGRRLAAGSTPGRYPGRTILWNDRIPAQDAAFVNTAMIRNLDFNDRYPGGHPSDCLGALLALAEGQKASGAGFLTAMVTAYEVFARLNDAIQLSRRGWDQGYAIALATASGVCNLLGLSFETTAEAIAIAGVAAVPLRATRAGALTPWKNAASAYACRDGLYAALLAAEGMPGPSHAFDGRHGLWDQITGPFGLAPFPSEGEYLTTRVQLKYFPVETNGQAPIWAALQLRERIDPADLTAVDVRLDTFGYHEIGSEPEKWDPQTHETADHSLPYVFARALVDGPITVASFEDELVRDPALRPLMAKIRVAPDPELDALLPETVLLRVHTTTRDGATHNLEIVNPLGHPANPMNDQHIEEKFSTLAEPVLGAPRVRTILDQWWQIDTAPDLAPALAALDLDVPQRS
jgi:2-methylcitrate dehydratase